MGSVLLRAFSFAFIILIGIFLRSKKLVGPEAGQVAQKLMLWVTLPAAAVVNFSTLDQLTLSMAILPILAILFTFSVCLIVLFLMRKRSRDDKIAYGNVVPGVNIGNFCLPFVQSFFPGTGTVSLLLYDVGNSVFCLGGVYAVISAFTGKEHQKFQVKDFLKTLFSSFPLDVYLLLLALALFGIRPPKALADFMEPIADANAFMAMMMLGLTFHMELKKEYFQKILSLLGLRYLFSAILSLLIWFVLPLDTLLKKILILIMFGPVNSVAGVFTAKSEGDEGLVSCVISFSVVCSLIAISGLLVLFNVM